MTYEETLAHIFSRGRFGIKPGLERVRHLLSGLGEPQRRLRVIQIAGTNGKGSTASFLAAILKSAGVRAGLYTSPHLTSFTERIRIDGNEVDEETVTRLARSCLAAAPSDSTFFELVTAMAFLHFAEEEVEYAIMEAGMGGRWDATNVADGILSIITPVGLDHCEYLGNTIADIAAEKAGIINAGRPTVVGLQREEALEAIGRRCTESTSSCYRLGEHFAASWETGVLSYRGMTIDLAGLKPGIGGRFQLGNAACALAAVELLAADGLAVGVADMRAGIEQARWPGRMELLGSAPRVLLDGAHNRSGAEALAETLPDVPYRRLLLLVGVMGDKDAEAILRPLLPMAHHVFAVAPVIDRAMPSAELADLCRRGGGTCTDAGTVADGLALAVAAAGPDDLVVVSGSLFTVGEASSILLQRRFQPFRG